MSVLLYSLSESLIFIILLIIGAYIFRNIAKEYELDTSFRIAFTLNFIMLVISVFIFNIPGLVIELLRISGIMLNATFFYVLIPIYIGIFGITLYIAILLIQKFYKTEFRESFSMLRLVFVYNIVIMIPLTPFMLSILNF